MTLATMLLAALLPASRCEPAVTYEDISMQCMKWAEDAPDHEPKDAYRERCEMEYARLLESAAAVDCQAEFEAYFWCRAGIRMKNGSACFDEWEEIYACARRNDPNNSCDRAMQRIIACTDEELDPIYPGICYGSVKCWAGCINAASCERIGQYRANPWREEDPIRQCSSPCAAAWLR